MNYKQYFVYIATNKRNTTLYTGVTNNLQRRIQEHKQGKGSYFTKKYKIKKLLYFETYNDINEAIAREKQIKNGPRKRKIKLVNIMNPNFRDLSEDF